MSSLRNCPWRRDSNKTASGKPGAVQSFAYVEQFLAPTLSPGDVLVLDNLSSHKVASVRDAIEARGATLLYLPPDSPDLDPIELAFSNSKASCATPPSAPSKRCGRPSADCSTGSPNRMQQLHPTLRLCTVNTIMD
jgi:hypothetical protein